MQIKDRIVEALQDGIKSNKELASRIGKSTRIISATISNNPSLFIRLEKGLVGLKGRDEDKITGRRIRNDPFALYKKMVNVLKNGEMSIDEISRLLPSEKRVSIRATATIRPDLFIRVKRGVIGRANRDEWLIEKYARANSKPLKKPRDRSISEKITICLLERPMTLEELHLRIAGHSRNAISGKLSLNPKFKRMDEGSWCLK
jgi:hypothetical protein